MKNNCHLNPTLYFPAAAAPSRYLDTAPTAFHVSEEMKRIGLKATIYWTKPAQLVFHEDRDIMYFIKTARSDTVVA